ncbi:BACON domain-containing protein [Endozoicomonas sp. G2_1]|uniref:BACON domain-containing protein n=1 Tax=Endozoicomonas sp. G2_1 TaxID=2821091 RepID=UPI001ADC0B7A|nr:BACON domain-containing protein [Endozoicomonas sp. G2_1]MBO9489183.1 BACON domain-containing protein [Endozoicomonas sp. G2_1]
MNAFNNSSVNKQGYLFSLFLLVVLLVSGCGGSSDNNPRFSISTNVSELKFSNQVLNRSDDSFSVNVSFQGEGLLVGFAPGADVVPWLEFSLENTTDNSATLKVDVINEERIAPGSFNTVVRLSTGSVAQNTFEHQDIDVSLLVWQLTPNTNLVSFGETFGATSIASQSFELTSVSDNQWQLSSDLPWLSFDASSGTGTSTVTVNVDLSGITAPGLSQGNITITEVTSGDTRLLPVELGLDNLYLYAEQAHVGLVNTANVSELSRQVAILSNNLTDFTWQAQTDADWLTLTQSSDGQFLTITADPSSAEINSLNRATITLTSSDITNVQAQNIDVHFYHSDQSSSAIRQQGLTINTNTLVTAPDQPIVYLATGNKLQSYHLYTGTQVSDIAVAPENTTLTNLIVHPNGQLMLAQATETVTDADGNEQTELRRYQINLSDNSVTTLDNSEVTLQAAPFTFVNIKGRYFVVTQALELGNENLERLFVNFEDTFGTNSADVSAQNNVFYALQNATSQLRRYSTAVNDFTTINKVGLTFIDQYRPETLGENDNITSFFVNNAETDVYLQSPTSNRLSYDGTTFTDLGLLELDTDRFVSLLFSPDSSKQARYARFDRTQGFLLDSYDQQANLASRFLLGTRQPLFMALAQDQQRVAYYSQGATEAENSLEINNTSEP